MENSYLTFFTLDLKTFEVIMSINTIKCHHQTCITLTKQRFIVSFIMPLPAEQQSKAHKHQSIQVKDEQAQFIMPLPAEQQSEAHKHPSIPLRVPLRD